MPTLGQNLDQSLQGMVDSAAAILAYGAKLGVVPSGGAQTESGGNNPPPPPPPGG